jgi:hypothetical protein
MFGGWIIPSRPRARRFVVDLRIGGRQFGFGWGFVGAYWHCGFWVRCCCRERVVGAIEVVRSWFGRRRINDQQRKRREERSAEHTTFLLPQYYFDRQR